MSETQAILDSHNQLCLAVSSALGSTQDPSQLLVLRSEVEEAVQLLDEVRRCILVVCIGGVDYPRD